MSPSTPDTCDGFNVTFMCSSRARDCVHGSCWHMDRVRQMVRRWFSILGPAPRTGWKPAEAPVVPEPKLTKAEREEQIACSQIAALVRQRRADAFWSEFDRRWAGVPARMWVYRDTGGGGWVGPDVDGTGSWGRSVRLWEDREDER